MKQKKYQNPIIPRILTLFEIQWNRNMETAGLEPASKDIATWATTRLVDILSFASMSAYRQAFIKLVWLVSTFYPQTEDERLSRL